jgi:two-component system sensor histidine kinase HupT/HoxJ
MEKTAAPALWIHAKTNGALVRLSFEDNGSGIPPENVERIFDPFFTTKSAGKGTGLGLSISDAIVRDHGGSIEAGNRKDGGAIFAVSLPVPQGKDLTQGKLDVTTGRRGIGSPQ